MPAPSLVAGARPEPVEQHRHDDEAADEGALPEGADPQQREAVADDLDQRRADDAAERGSGAADEVGAADDRGGDDGQLHALPEAGRDRAEPADFEDARDAGAQAAEHIDADLDGLDRNPRQRGGLLVAADGEEVPAPAHPPEGE